MIPEITFLSCLIALRIAITTAEPTAGGIDRTLTKGVTSMGYNIIYGDKDLTILNSVVDEVEKRATKARVRLNELIEPLKPEDVKCMMSADHYCSKEMKETKGIIIQAIKDDCKDCSTAQKENAGRVISAMMAHDPSSWKLFLTRYDGLKKIQRIMAVALLKFEEKRKSEKKIPEPEKDQYRIVGEPEEIRSLKENRFILPGAKVRVRRYVMEKVVG